MLSNEQKAHDLAVAATFYEVRKEEANLTLYLDDVFANYLHFYHQFQTMLDADDKSR